MDFEEKNPYWKVFATDDVEEDLSEFVRYLLYEKLNEQAADAVIRDYDDTLSVLERVAGSLKTVDNLRLAKFGYKRINFQRYNYYLLFRLEGNTAVVDGMYHDLQDQNGIMR